MVRQMMAYLTDRVGELQSVQSTVVSKASETVGISQTDGVIHVRNLDSRESSLARISTDRFRKTLGLPSGDNETITEMEAALPAPQFAQRADEVWPLAMWLLLAVLVAEMLLASRVHA
jgi:hypothetical protein